jgi:hypothetical protein
MTLTQINQMFSIATSCVVIIAGDMASHDS